MFSLLLLRWLTAPWLTCWWGLCSNTRSPDRPRAFPLKPLLHTHLQAHPYLVLLSALLNGSSGGGKPTLLWSICIYTKEGAIGTPVQVPSCHDIWNWTFYRVFVVIFYVHLSCFTVAVWQITCCFVLPTWIWFFRLFFITLSVWGLCGTKYL